MTILHLLGRDEWQRAETAGVYTPASLATEGFIHFSTDRQLLRSAQRFFADRDDLVAISVQEERLTAPLRFELADGERFPHLYGPLNLDAVVEVVALPLVNGRHAFPASWAGQRQVFVGSPRSPR